MAVIINSAGSDKFSLNGKTYSRIFQPLAAGLTHVSIYNTFDTRLQILSPTHYSEFTVNGISYMDQTTLIQGLLNVIYVSTGGGGGGGGTWGDITGTISDQGDLWSALGGKENTFSKNTAFNKNFGTSSGTVAQGNHTHTFASITSKPTTLAGYGITNALKNTTDTLTGNFTATGNITANSRLFGGKGLVKTYNQNADLAQFVHRDLDTNYTQYGMLMSSTGTMYYGATAHNFTAGNVGIGVENPTQKLSVGGQIKASSNITTEGFLEIKAAYPQINFNNNVNTRLMYRVDNELRFRFDGTNDGTLWHSGNSFTKSGYNYSFGGNITATSFFESSDKRLKTNVEPISDTFRTYEMKDNPTKRYGVIAQDIIKTNPELVRMDDEGMMSVNYTDLLVMKMAEMENKVKEQDDKIARLEAMVEQLINKG